MFRTLYLLLIVLIAACGSPSAPPPATLRISIPMFPSTFDPRCSGDFVSATVICLISEGLMRCKTDGTVESALAERVEISSDQKTYRFFLRKATWSDGRPITARDFEQSWKKILDPAFGSPSAYLFYPILNAESAFRKEKSLDAVGIHVLGERVLEVQLEHPTPIFLSLTAFPSYMAIPTHCLDEIGDLFSLERLSAGPFCIENIAQHASIVLRKNPHFWNARNIRLEQIQIHIVPSESTALHMFELGQLDWIGGVLSPIPPDALASSRIQSALRYFPVAATTFCTFNTQKFPFSNETLRKAFSIAIDREEMAKLVFPLRQIPASRPIPPTLCGGRNRSLYSRYNPELAKQLFAQGLQEIGGTLEPMTFYYRSGIIDGRIAQVLQRKWKEVLGVDVKLEQLDFKMHKDILLQRKYEIALANWVAQYQDPLNILERFKTARNSKNYPGWENNNFIAYLEKACATLNASTRAQMIKRAEEILAAQVPIIPLYHWNNPSLCNPKLCNVHTTPCGGVLFERCWFEEE